MEHDGQPRHAGWTARLWPRGGHVLAAGVLLVSVVLVFVTWSAARQREIAAAEQAFVARTSEATDQFRQGLSRYELVARGGVSLFASVARPTPKQWQDYVDGMDLPRRFPAIVGLGFAGYVPASRLPDLQLEWRESGYGMLDVRPHGRRAEYGPILYLEPRTPANVAAVGFDMYASPVRREAMQRAIESGQPSLTGPVNLVQDGPLRRTGLLLYVPIYRTSDRPDSRASRLVSAQGWIYLPFHLEPFVEATLGSRRARMHVRIVDVSAAGQPVLYDGGAATDQPAFRHSTEVELYGRRWRVDYASLPLAEAAPGLHALRGTFALGLLAALLLYGIALVLARTEARAHRIARDLTEDYRRSEARFRSAMQYSAIGKVLLDSAGAIVDLNPALAHIVGRRPDDLLGRPFESLFADEPDVGTRHAEGGGVWRAMRRVQRPDDSIRHVHVTWSPVPGNIGQDVAGLAQVEDVTERLLAEARVHALNRTLEARVALRTRELMRANHELESFAYSVSHDLRAPLRAIDGFSRILAERYSDRLDEAGRGYLTRVRRAAGRMGELIDSMLQLSRLTRSALKPEEVDLSRIAIEVADELRAAEPGRDVAIDIEPGLVTTGDAALLRNVMVNLLGNAWKFTREREDARIEFGMAPSGEYFVRDNGAGFPQEYVDKLFRPFQRLHTEEHFAGHGIGLATVRRIVERHGGEIRAEGEPGKGATFYFTLPGMVDAPPAE